MIIERILSPLLTPLILICLAFMANSYIHLIPEAYLPLISYLPFVLFLASLLLCLQFNQFRNIILAIILSLSYLIIQLFLQSSLEQQLELTLYFLLSTSLPLLIILISWLPEKGFLSNFSILTTIFLGITLSTLSYLYFNPTLISPLLNYFPIREWGFSILSPFAMIIYFIAITHQLIRLWFHQQPFDAALSVILVTLVINFSLFDKFFISTILFSTAQLILIWGIQKQSHNMAYLDELTGIPGRRALNEALKSPGRKYVLAMMDIDFFKKFNDKYGHDVGDDVLKIVAGKMAKVTGGGKAYRYGGEEFTVFFKGKDLVTCVPHLEAVREDIANYKIALREKITRPKTKKEGKTKRGAKRQAKKISVAISIGVARKCDKYSTPTEVLKAADKVLYKAKKAGRNCLVSDKS